MTGIENGSIESSNMEKKNQGYDYIIQQANNPKECCKKWIQRIGKSTEEKNVLL